MKRIIGLILPLGLAAGLAQGAIYTWKGPNGHTVYSDHPPPPSLHIGPVKEFTARPVPAAAQLKAASAPLAANPNVPQVNASQVNASQVVVKKATPQNPAVQAENCQRARYSLTVLQANLSRQQAGAKGKPTPEQSDTQNQLAQAQRDVAINCTNLK